MLVNVDLKYLKNDLQNILQVLEEQRYINKATCVVNQMFISLEINNLWLERQFDFWYYSSFELWKNISYIIIILNFTWVILHETNTIAVISCMIFAVKEQQVVITLRQ